MRSRRDRSPIEAWLGFSSASARAERRGAAGEAAVAKGLRRLFADVANDLILPDGGGGLTQVDHLVLTPAGLLVIETKNYRGMILGSAYERTWTQVVGLTRNQFQNPLRQNHAHIEAVKALAPGVPVIGRVVFLDGARFPKGVPDGVAMLGALRRDLAGLQGADIPPPTALGWERVLRFALTGPAARRAHLDGLKERHGEGEAAAGADNPWDFDDATRSKVRGKPVDMPLRPFVRLGLTFALVVGGLWVGSSLLGALVSRDRQPAPPVARKSQQSTIPSALAPLARTPVPIRPTAPSPSTIPPRKSPPPRPAPMAPQPVVSAHAPLAWSEDRPTTSQSPECVQAIASVLAKNTAENRQQRDRACR